MIGRRQKNLRLFFEGHRELPEPVAFLLHRV